MHPFLDHHFEALRQGDYGCGRGEAGAGLLELLVLPLVAVHLGGGVKDVVAPFNNSPAQNVRYKSTRLASFCPIGVHE